MASNYPASTRGGSTRGGTSNVGGSSVRGEEFFDYKLYVTPDISEDDVRTMREVFDALDTSQDGHIEVSELKSAVLAIGINVDESNTGIQQLTGSTLTDTAGSAQMSFDQFYKIIAKHQAKGDKFTVDNVFKIFLQLDANHDCKLAGDASKKRVTKDEKRNKIPEKWQRKGCITWEDLKGLVEDLGEQVDDDVLKDMILTLDLDEDGVLGPDDFYQAINNGSRIQAKQRTASNPFSNLKDIGAPVGNQRSNTNLSREASGISTRS
jgi:Ca2+-binding EF-hand superfamily protein